ncbi:hypothetical protein BC826DRAFT_1101598 [Russula brevipes]|nr:hypothetical protein BC826DRAFT_1101598 [Russula brevipes]
MSSHSRAQKSVQGPVVVQANIIAQRVLPCATGTDGPSEDLQMGERSTYFRGPRGKATANKLPDDVLLYVFEIYLNENNPHGLGNLNGWQTLVHVCRRWRDIVFASSRGLNLRLLCNRDTPVRTMLDIWPALPIGIHDDWTRRYPMGPDNIIAALEHPDRVCSIELYEFPRSAWEGLATTMQVPFPELTDLDLWWSSDSFMPALPDSFLSGSAPRLRTLKLCDIAVPALPNLLLSASDLVTLSILPLPYPEYISPASMVACLSSLNRLQTLSFGFQYQFRNDQPSPPPQTRAVFPALTDLTFEGMTGYLDDFLSRIDTPVLNKFSMSLTLNFDIDAQHLRQFIGRATGLKPYKVARVAFTIESIQLELTGPLPLSLEMNCDMIDLEVDGMSLICGQLSPFLSLVERLELTENYWLTLSEEEYDPLSSRFLELFEPFTAIRSLYVSEGLIPLIVLALQQLTGERATEVLPSLRDLFMEGSEKPRAVQEAMQPFLTPRRLSGQPVAVHHQEGSTADR